VTQRFLVRAAGRIVAEADRTSPTSTAWRYIHVDQLGSPAVITDKLGNHVRVSFDPWGRSRNADAWTDYYPPAPPLSWVIGFTGHQAVLDVGLIDMGARLYDPVVGRFATVDPVVADGFDGLAYNPYAYVRNNPLSRRDPTGLAPTGTKPSGGGGGGDDGEGDDGEDDDGGSSSGDCDDEVGCDDNPGPKDDGSPVPGEPDPMGGETGGGDGPGAGGTAAPTSIDQAEIEIARIPDTISTMKWAIEEEERAEAERMHQWSEMLEDATEEPWEGVEIEIEKPEVEEHHFAKRSGRLDLHGPNAEPQRAGWPRLSQTIPHPGAVIPVPAQPGLDRAWRTPLAGRAAPALGRSITPPVTVTTGATIEADNRALDLHGQHGLDDFLDGAWWQDAAVSK
jgi:RHS repeat-associated protein